MPTCSTCIYWLPDTDDEFQGTCKRYPPVFAAFPDATEQMPTNVGQHFGYYWQVKTSPDDRCGEHKDE